MHRNYEHCKEKMMKQISAKSQSVIGVWLLFVVGICILLFTACNNTSDFTGKELYPSHGQTMYLKRPGISNVELIDSAKPPAAGKFKFYA